MTRGTANGLKLPGEISLIASRETWTLKYYLKIRENASYKSLSAASPPSPACVQHTGKFLSGIPVNFLPTSHKLEFRDKKNPQLRHCLYQAGL